MLVDDVEVFIAAGSGGDGAVAFKKEKMSQGPTGGSGGKGGDIYIKGVSDLGALGKFRYKKRIVAENGENGGVRLCDGRDGSDIILEVPVGTVAHNLDTGEQKEVLNIGQQELVARGGRGGKGNFQFRSSTNTSPQQYQEGKEGEASHFRLELKLIADVGFVGLPNVGKSSLLNELTNASSKVANYPFTTLEPNLGVYYELVLADIPGLIKGASSGKGLGIKFLRSVEHTKVLFHIISAESENPLHDYKVVRDELKKYGEFLLEKEEYVFLSKKDLLSDKELKKKTEKLKEAVPFSVIDDESLEKVKEILRDIISRKKST